MRVAIIPARGGSKRIPRKNIKSFCGKPMIAWSIIAAKASMCFDRIIVSTDDERIAEISQEYGAEVPFLRPAALADDHTSTAAVISHSIGFLKNEGVEVAEACCIYATAPFLRPSDIKRGLECLQESDAHFAFSVTTYPFPIQRAIRITRQRRIEMFQPEYFNCRSQDLEDAWHDAGQFYWGRADAWLSEEQIFSPLSIPVILPRHRVQDIDTQEDWIMAELMFRAHMESGIDDFLHVFDKAAGGGV